MSILVFLFIGLIAGWIAGHIVEGHGFGGIADMLIGIVGAFIGGYIFDVLNIATYGFWGNVAMSAVGAVVFLFFIRLISRPRSLRKS